MLVFDGKSASPDVAAAVIGRDALADLGRRRTETAIRCWRSFRRDARGTRRSCKRSCILSTDRRLSATHGGGWVDETTPRAPVSAGRERSQPEQAWQAFGRQRRRAVAHPAALGGIYGPGQNALAQSARGSAKRIDKPGQVSQPHPCRRHRAGDRRRFCAPRRRHLQSSPTTSRPRRAYRSPSRPSCSASTPPPESRSPKPQQDHVAVGADRSIAGASACVTTGSRTSLASRCAIRPIARACAHCSTAGDHLVDKGC